MPVAVDQFGSYVYQGGSYGDIEFPAEPQDHATVDQFLGLSSSNDDTYTGGPLPAPSTVTVSVLNGSGAYNQATDTSQSLQALGFKIGTIGDSPPVGQEAETVVYYSSKTPAELAAAQAVANSMTGAVIMAEDPTQVSPGSQVTVVTGTDFTVNAPPAPTTPTDRRRGGGPRATTTTVPASTGNTGNSGRVPGTHAGGGAARALGPPIVHAERRRGHLSGGRPRSSGEDLAAVRVERLAGHGRREVRRQVDDGAGDVLVARDPAQRHPRVELVDHDLGRARRARSTSSRCRCPPRAPPSSPGPRR